MEPSATDGAVDDILGPIQGLAAATDLVKASDGLQFGTRDALGGKISFEAAYAMASINIEKLLGVDTYSNHGELVATSGEGLLSFEAKVLGIISPRRGLVDLF
ncbi:hypothetical protein HWV62_14062 [Athelia sp. TMB]|nr:hypothetical protein HWV62_14062 [Athelia sp. TMB]